MTTTKLAATSAKLREALRRRFRERFPQTGMWQYNRLPLYSPALPFVVLWSQKAASTVVLKWFFQQVGLLETAIQYNSFAHVYETEIFKRQRGYARSVKVVLDDDNIEAIKFVRDPAARAFSSYLFLNRLELYSRTDDPAFYWRQRVLRHLYGARAKTGQIFSFKSFLIWLNEAAPRNIDGHLAPQFTAIEERLGVRLKIYRAEEFEHATAAIEQRFALPPTPAAQIDLIRKSNHHRPKQSHADTLDQILNEGLPNPAETRLPIPEFNSQTIQRHPDIRELIGAYFADDYRAYGYKLDG